MTKGENLQLTSIATEIAKLTQQMSDHNKLHTKLDAWMEKTNDEIYGKGTDPGIRGEIDQLQSKQNHIWYLYGLIIVAIIGSVVEGIFGGG